MHVKRVAQRGGGIVKQRLCLQNCFPLMKQGVHEQRILITMKQTSNILKVSWIINILAS